MRGGGVARALEMGGGTTCVCLAGAGAVGEKQLLARDAIGGRGTEILVFLPLPALQPYARPTQGPGARKWGTDRPRGSREQGKTKEGSKQGTDQQRGLSDREDVKVSKYWLLLTDQ